MGAEMAKHIGADPKPKPNQPSVGRQQTKPWKVKNRNTERKNNPYKKGSQS